MVRTLFLPPAKRAGETAIKSEDAAIDNLVPFKPFCMEYFQENPLLGRSAVRKMRQMVAVGVIKSVNFEDLSGDKDTKAADYGK